MFINDAVVIWKYAAQVYNSRQLSEEFENIHQRISDVYSDIADAHLEAARDAILAVEYSKSPSLEIRAAIGHMREAFNILKQVVDKKIENQFLIFFTREKYVMKNRKDSYKCLAYLSALISIMYSSLQEPENANRWKHESSVLFLNYNEFVTLTAEELKSIDMNLVNADYDYGKQVSYSAYQDWETDYDTIIWNYEINEKGYQYIKNWKLKLHKNFLHEIDCKILST
jgi:hypothetical protein